MKLFSIVFCLLLSANSVPVFGSGFTFSKNIRTKEFKTTAQSDSAQPLSNYELYQASFTLKIECAKNLVREGFTQFEEILAMYSITSNDISDIQITCDAMGDSSQPCRFKASLCGNETISGSIKVYYPLSVWDWSWGNSVVDNRIDESTGAQTLSVECQGSADFTNIIADTSFFSFIFRETSSSSIRAGIAKS